MSITFYPNYIHAAGFSKTAEPSITGLTYTCSGGETSGAVYDLVDNRNSNIVTIDSNGEGTDINVDLDLTANITDADFAIVDNHNFGTAGAEIKITYGGITQALSSAYSGTLGSELSTETISGDEIKQPIDDGILLANFTGTRTAQNWEIDIDYDGIVLGQFNADITIGEIAIGVSFSPTISPDVPQPEAIEYGNSIAQSRGGQKNAVQFHGKRRRWTLGWKIIQESDMTSLKTVWDTCNGTLYPFWIDLGEGSTNPLLYYVRFTGDFSYTKLTNQAYSLRLTIEEEL